LQLYGWIEKNIDELKMKPIQLKKKKKQKEQY